jgi:hypothetical protein
MKYRKIPVVIEANQFDGSEQSVLWFKQQYPHFIKDDTFLDGEVLKIHTLEGVMLAKKGDWIIEGVNKELYPCKPDIFKKTYEKVK